MLPSRCISHVRCRCEGPAHEAEPLEHGVGSLDSPERVQRDPTRQTLRSKLGEMPRDDHKELLVHGGQSAWAHDSGDRSGLLV